MKRNGFYTGPGTFRKSLLKTAFCLVLLTFIFTGCAKKTEAGEKPADEKAAGTTKICATFYPLYIMLMNLTENVPGVELSLLAPANTGCLHDYQLTTRDMKKITDCGILVANGAGMEDFLEKALSVKKDSTVIASENIPLLEGNPHVWVSPVNYVLMLGNIDRGLERLDPSHADLYRQNYMTYSKNISDLALYMHTELDSLAGKQVITFHEAFPYFVREFNLDCLQVIEREPGQAPDPKELSRTISIIKDEMEAGKKPALFAEPQYAASAAKVIAKETGLKVYELDPSVTGELTANAYVTAMKKNTLVLKEALQ